MLPYNLFTEVVSLPFGCFMVSSLTHLNCNLFVLRREEVDDSEHFSCQVDGQFDLTLSSQR